MTSENKSLYECVRENLVNGELPSDFRFRRRKNRTKSHLRTARRTGLPFTIWGARR